MSNLVVILMGGLSDERKISFLTGKACSEALKKKGYKVVNLDAKGYFVEELKKLKPKLVFNALHGQYGEDGFVQSILEFIKIPYTHSGVLSSSLAMDKELSRILFKKNKIKTPKYFLLQKGYEGNLKRNGLKRRVICRFSKQCLTIPNHCCKLVASMSRRAWGVVKKPYDVRLG